MLQVTEITKSKGANFESDSYIAIAIEWEQGSGGYLCYLEVSYNDRQGFIEIKIDAKSRVMKEFILVMFQGAINEIDRTPESLAEAIIENGRPCWDVSAWPVETIGARPEPAWGAFWRIIENVFHITIIANQHVLFSFAKWSSFAKCIRCDNVYFWLDPSDNLVGLEARNVGKEVIDNMKARQ